MSNFYNPDYPVSNPGGFVQHTYQSNATPNNTFWYGGMGSFDMGMSTIPADSRRNDGMTMYPQFPTMGASTTIPQFGSQVPMSVPTTNPSSNNGLPFSSYPANQPAQNQPAFNSLVESRRFAPTPQTNVTSNPWAAQNQPVQPQFPAMSTPQPTVNVPNPWMCSTPINYNDPNCTALYSDTQFGFERGSGSWDNGYVPQRTIIPPNIDWSAPRQSQPCQYQYPAYASFGQTPTQISWKDAADRNWGSGGSF